jgi:integrating conjugative element protein (TIGR03761 family)
MTTASILRQEDNAIAPAELELACVTAPRSVVRMPIRTRETQRLLRGRPAADGKPAIIGLFGFAERVRIIWDAAKLSDPYAIWWLLRVEEACGAAQAAIAIEHAKIQERLSAAPEFEIETGIDEPPLRVELNFACPYAYQGASALAAFDQFVVGALTAERLGLRHRASRSRNRFQCERAIRRLFATPNGYQALGITKGDVLSDAPMAQQARASMGRIPQAVLSGERWPGMLAPVLIPPSSHPPGSS